MITCLVPYPCITSRCIPDVVSLLLLSPPELPVLLIAQDTEGAVSSLLNPRFWRQHNNSARLSPVITATCLRRCHPKYAQVFLTEYVPAAFMRDCVRIWLADSGSSWYNLPGHQQPHTTSPWDSNLAYSSIRITVSSSTPVPSTHNLSTFNQRSRVPPIYQTTTTTIRMSAGGDRQRSTTHPSVQGASELDRAGTSDSTSPVNTFIQQPKQN
jgi:hypothetical protein